MTCVFLYKTSTQRKTKKINDYFRMLFVFNLNKHIFAVKINNRHEVYILPIAVRPL